MIKTALYTGRQLKQLVKEKAKVATTQTAVQAVTAIIKKFGSIKDNAHYYHRGNGIWSQYIISEDRKKTGQIAEDRQRWKMEPWRYDLHKIDTKEGLTIKRAQAIKPKQKHNKKQKVTQRNIFARY